jgi:Protein of unknown function (DUF2442)
LIVKQKRLAVDAVTGSIGHETSGCGWMHTVSTLEIDVGDLRARSVEFTSSELVVTLIDGRRIATPLDWYPRLLKASAAQRSNYEIMAMGIRWPDLDENLGIVGMLKGRKAL